MTKQDEKILGYCFAIVGAFVAMFISFSYPFFKELLKNWWEMTENGLAVILLLVPYGLITITIAGVAFASGIVGSVFGLIIADIVAYFINFKNEANRKDKKNVIVVEMLFLVITIIGCKILDENYYIYLAAIGIIVVIWEMCKIKIYRA